MVCCLHLGVGSGCSLDLAEPRVVLDGAFFVLEEERRPGGASIVSGLPVILAGRKNQVLNDDAISSDACDLFCDAPRHLLSYRRTEKSRFGPLLRSYHPESQISFANANLGSICRRGAAESHLAMGCACQIYRDWLD